MAQLVTSLPKNYVEFLEPDVSQLRAIATTYLESPDAKNLNFITRK